jgi:poly(A) polymerase Pap1
MENKKVNDQLYNDYIAMIDNFYLFRNYFEKINYNTNINCVNKMTDEEKLEITNEINQTNTYICSIVNKFEYKLKLDINKYTDSFIEIKENYYRQGDEMFIPQELNTYIKTQIIWGAIQRDLNTLITKFWH